MNEAISVIGGAHLDEDALVRSHNVLVSNATSQDMGSFRCVHPSVKRGRIGHSSAESQN
jgi:hypothetical protein